jgi:putative transcriptional regulator
VVMPLAHGFASRAVLVGSSATDPSSRNLLQQLLERLRDLLVDPTRWGLDHDNCSVLVDPADHVLEQALEAAGEQVRRGGLLFVYYVGPVQLVSHNGLALTFPEHAFPYEKLRWYVKDQLGTHLVMFDCVDTPVNAAAIADAAMFEGLELVVHAQGSTGTRASGITGRLISLLNQGLRRGPSRLGLASIRDMLGDGPSLAIRSGTTTDGLALVRNPALYLSQREGQVLLAFRGVTRAGQDQAVILILRYDKDLGAVGLVLNRPGTESAPAPNWPGATHQPDVVFDGGPATHEGYIALALLWRGAAEPAQFHRVRSRLGTLSLESRQADGVVERYRLFRGYVGWAPGQLEEDIRNDSVVPADVDLDLLLATETEDLWPLVRRQI